MPLFIRANAPHRSDLVVLVQPRTYNFVSTLHGYVGEFSPYTFEGQQIPAINPYWHISLIGASWTKISNVEGTEEIPVDTDFLFFPVGRLDLCDPHDIRQYMKQVLKKLWNPLIQRG